MEATELKLLCSGCGANLEYSAGARALKCVYCGAVTEIARADDEEVDEAPDHVVTLVVSRSQLEDAVFQHLAEGKYTPDNLLEHATFTKVEQFFVPAFAFTGTYEAQWTASFGYDRTEHYTDYVRDSNGNTRPVTKTRTVTDWRPVNGTDTGDFSVLTYGGSQLNNSSLNLPVQLVERCAMGGDVVDYSPSFTSGFEVEAYSVRPNDAYSGRGEELVNGVIDVGVRRHAQGDRQKDWHWKATTRKRASRILVPVCHVVYEYDGQSFNVWLDGTSTANLVADVAPEDHSRKRAVRIGFIPGAIAAAGLVGSLVSTGGDMSSLPESPLIWVGTIGALLFGAARRHAILSYSIKLRKAILAQRKLDTTNAANVDDAARLAMVEACKRPDRPWLAGTIKDAVWLPVTSVIALAVVLTPLLHQVISDHRGVQYAPDSASVFQSSTTSNEKPSRPTLASAQNGPAPQSVQQVPTTTTEPVQQADVGASAGQQASAAPEPAVPQAAQVQTPSLQIAVAGPVLAVLNAASQNDWAAVDLAADNLKDSGASNMAHGDRARARTANIDGKAALQAKNYAAAVEAFRRGVAADPADIELQNNLGYALEESGQQQDAIDAISNVLVRAPRRTAAWANLASSLAESGHLPEAKAAMGVAVHYTGNRDRTLAFLQEQAATGRTEAIRQMSAAVSQQALTIPLAAAAPKMIPQPTQAPNVAQVSRPVARTPSSEGDEAYVQHMNKQLEQQLKDLSQSK